MCDFPFSFHVSHMPLPLYQPGSIGMKQLAKGSVFGMGVNLYNNLWSTNYITYCKSRFLRGSWAWQGKSQYAQTTLFFSRLAFRI